MYYCPNRPLSIGLENLEDDNHIDKTGYPVVGETATKSEHEEDERDIHIYYHEIFSFFY